MSSIFTYTDTGTSTTDGFTTDGTITLALAVDTVTWDYSLDNGISWDTGIGNSFVLPDGSYAKANILVKQYDIAGNNSISTMSGMVQLEAIGVTDGWDYNPQITAVGTAGEYVVTFYGQDSAGYGSIFVQKFNANGTILGSMVQLEAIGVANDDDYEPQITSVGTLGEYVVTFDGQDSAGGDFSIFVQKFNSDGTAQGSMVQLEAIGNTIGDRKSVV